MKPSYEIRYASHPVDAKLYNTERIRKEFLVSELFLPHEIKMVYSFQERFIVGGIMPVKETLILSPIDIQKTLFFLERREMGIINVGGSGIVECNGKKFDLSFKEALYIGLGKKNPVFKSIDPSKPAKFYFNSAPAHKEFPDKKVTLKDAEVTHLGSTETSNARTINKLLVNSVVETCQLQMGMTELQPGSVWNTMPPHVHARRNEVYFYFDVPTGQVVCHFMGEPQETRHLWMHNEEAVISPVWSIHSAAGTSNYSFIWGMAGENLDYNDMDSVKPDQLQ
jgi:4-deoxy-L-threo-5-hexosulose-uronate ketol-isomerase